MKTRVISGAVGVVIFAAVFWLQITFKALPIFPFVLALLAAMAVYELLYVTGHMKNPVALVAGVLAAVCLVLRQGGVLPVRFLYIIGAYAIIVLLCALWKNKDITPANAAFALIAAPAVGFAFATILPVMGKASNFFFFWMLFICAWGADTGAYFAGRFFGKHKLAPVLSPKKTVEGLIGGVVAAIVLTVVLYLVLYNHLPNNWVKCIGSVTLLTLAGVIGDITASYIKRDAGIKDYGKLMPGHGGVMDRFDSVLFIAPIVYIIF